MKQIFSSLAVAALISLNATASTAECYADYKAKQDDPLRLHYGVMQVSDCDAGAARKEVTTRLKSNGWTLLNIMSVFGPEGLDQRKANAGNFYLRY
ncbi:hypothetical protein SAMN05444358_10656 [Ruegeria halocynthiae]|uniref:Uncharacterized protein n=1 Tax=Ruegeria halocynthiae TaxID=985054 RepID=A0A1H3BY51_9RHOB|nr:hypothetical protein [Ruegeria halocynthiae]SDX46803.1 hypothetical protein SAMN05444358_10656 [Ruegeria halocynthiae]